MSYQIVNNLLSNFLQWINLLFNLFYSFVLLQCLYFRTSVREGNLQAMKFIEKVRLLFGKLMHSTIRCTVKTCVYLQNYSLIIKLCTLMLIPSCSMCSVKLTRKVLILLATFRRWVFLIFLIPILVLEFELKPYLLN